MPVPRFFFSVRWLMVAVALTALAMSGWVWNERAGAYRKQASAHAWQERSNQARTRALEGVAQMLEMYDRVKIDYKNVSQVDDITKKQFQELGWSRLARRKRAEAAGCAALAVYHAELNRKYERAARRPWEAVAPDPPPPDLTERAFFWYQRGEYARALADYDELLRARADSAWAENGRAWIWATCPVETLRNGERAVASAALACELTEWRNASVLDTLAAAYAESGDFEAAVKWQREALKFLPSGWDEAQGFHERLKLYQSRRPYREGPKPLR